MLKVITLPPGQSDSLSKLELIESISKATNQQTAIDEADRRSNDRVQIELQKNLFSTFGFFYERKRGEFLDGLRQDYIRSNQVISRETVLRVCCALKGQVSEARRQSSKKLFSKHSFDSLLDDGVSHKAVFYGVKCFEHLAVTEKQFSGSLTNKFGVANYGQGLRYGKYAIVAVVCKELSPELVIQDYEEKVKEETDAVLQRWIEFESYVKTLSHNRAYFSKTKDPDTGKEVLEVNFDGYYKGSTLNRDIGTFFGFSNEWSDSVIKNWRESVENAIRSLTKQTGALDFTRQQLIEKYFQTIVSEVGSSGKTPHQTLSRVLQELRDRGIIEFIRAGEYRLIKR
jgi:hypothetical protein